MKTKLAFLCVPALMGVMLTSSASAGNISANAMGNGSLGNRGSSLNGSSFCPGSAYCNGEINGTVDAWTINFGFTVSDSFILGAAGTVTGAAFGFWDASRAMSGSGRLGHPVGRTRYDCWRHGVVLRDGCRDARRISASINSGMMLRVDAFSLSPALGAGTYYLELQNAVVPSGDPVYWDENDGASTAWENSIGYLTTANTSSCTSPGSTGYCSEAFAVYTSTQATVPEPGTLVLGGSGLLLLAGALRRKLNR